MYRTQVHIQIDLISIFLYDYSHELVGSVLARLERSTLPAHKGTRTVVLRFLKIITPVKCVKPLYDDYICFPREGELFRRLTNEGKPIVLHSSVRPVWSVDIDQEKKHPMKRGLQLLWDATTTSP